MIEIIQFYIPSLDFIDFVEPFGYRAIVKFGKISSSCCFLLYEDAVKFGEEKLAFFKKTYDI